MSIRSANQPQAGPAADQPGWAAVAIPAAWSYDPPGPPEQPAASSAATARPARAAVRSTVLKPSLPKPSRPP